MLTSGLFTYLHIVTHTHTHSDMHISKHTLMHTLRTYIPLGRWETEDNNFIIKKHLSKQLKMNADKETKPSLILGKSICDSINLQN